MVFSMLLLTDVPRHPRHWPLAGLRAREPRLMGTPGAGHRDPRQSAAEIFCGRSRAGRQDGRDGSDSLVSGAVRAPPSVRSSGVKYLLMIYQNPGAWQGMAESEKKAMMSQAGAIVDELIASGEWV